MSRLSTAATFAAIVAVATPAAFAQTKAAPENRTEATGATANKMSIQPDQIRASKMLGSTVYDSQNRNIGSLEDLVLDKNGEIDEVVIDIGAVLGVGGKYVAVKMSDIKADNNRLDARPHEGAIAANGGIPA